MEHIENPSLQLKLPQIHELVIRNSLIGSNTIRRANFVPNHRRPARRCSYFKDKTVECTRPHPGLAVSSPTLPGMHRDLCQNIDRAVIKRTRRSGAVERSGPPNAFILFDLPRSRFGT
jgi:hypothetical protein